MRKKVAFAAAIVHAPELLFLDEPFESIDPAGAAMLKGWLCRFDTLEALFLHIAGRRSAQLEWL